MLEWQQEFIDNAEPVYGPEYVESLQELGRVVREQMYNEITRMLDSKED